MTGPSFTSSTSMCAPNDAPPDADTRGAPARAANASTRSAATSGAAAAVHDGRRPLRTSPYSVNCDTTRTSPPTSASARFILPVGVGEQPQVDDLLGQPLDLADRRPAPDAHQQQVARADRRDRLAVDATRRRGETRWRTTRTAQPGTTRYASNTPSTRFTAASTLDRCAMSASSNVNRSRVMRSRPVGRGRRQDVHVAVGQHRGHVGEQPRRGRAPRPGSRR